MNYLNKVFVLFLLFSLSSCTGDMCIDAEDFGFVSLDVSSRYDDSELLGEKDKQVAPWRTTSFVANGRPIMIVVKDWKFKIYDGYTDSNNPSEVSGWCPWYGQPGDEITFSDMNKRLPTCQVNGSMCTQTAYLNVSNPPCIFTKGIGLYALLATQDPNLNKSTMQSPDGLSFHLGDAHPSYNLYYLGQQAGGILFDYTNQPGVTAQQLQNQYTGAKLYLKILDTYYRDNSGQYKVLIKSGADYGEPGPITRVLNQCKNILFGASTSDRYGVVKNIYNGILNNSSYQFSVRMVLVLYVVLSGLSFLAGTINMTHTELSMRVIKICFIFALVNTTKSWNFFHDYLFVFFIEGVDEISGRFMGQNGSSTSGLTFFDGMLNLMLGMKTLAKLSSLLFTTWFGFIFILVYLCLCFGYMWIMINSVVLYLMSIISIGIIITMAPIFFCFGLFDATKSLFQNWLKQIISYTLQPIILLVGLSMAGLIIRHEIYTTLGFQVCKQTLFDMGDIFAAPDAILGAGTIPKPTSFLYWWFPSGSPASFCHDSSRYATIPVPEDHVKADGTFCPAYGCFENRCIDMPFIDPTNSYDVSKLQMIQGTGSITLIQSLMIFFLLIYLLQKYNSASGSIAKTIAGTTGNLTDISGAAGLATAGMQTAFGKATSRMAENLSMRFDRAIYRGREDFKAGIARVKNGESFFKPKPKKQKQPPSKLRVVLNKTVSAVSGNYFVKKAAEGTSILAKKGFQKLAATKLGVGIKAQVSNINESIKAFNQEHNISETLNKVSNKYAATKRAALLASISAGEGIYNGLTGTLKGGRLEKVSDKFAALHMHKTAKVFHYISRRSIAGMVKDGLFGIVKTAHFLAVHRGNGIKYLVKKAGMEVLQDVKWVGVGVKEAGAKVAVSGYDKLSANLNARAHFADDKKIDKKLLARAEKISGVDYVKLKQDRKKLSEFNTARRENINKELQALGLSTKEIRKLTKNNNLSDKELNKLIKNLEKNPKIDKSKLENLKTTFTNIPPEIKDIQRSVISEQKALKAAYTAEIVNQISRERVQKNPYIKLGSSSELTAAHFADDSKMRMDVLKDAELKSGLKYEDLKVRSDDLSKLGMETATSVKEIQKASGLSDKEFKDIAKRLNSVETTVNERLVEMKRANPNLDEKLARKQIEGEVRKEILVDLSKKNKNTQIQELEKKLNGVDKEVNKRLLEMKKVDPNLDEKVIRKQIETEIKEKIIQDFKKENPKLAGIVDKLSSVETKVNERLVEMQKANPNLDEKVARKQIEQEVNGVIFNELRAENSKQRDENLKTTFAKYEQVSEKYTESSRQLDYDNSKLKKAYSQELAKFEIGTKKQQKARKEEMAYLRGDAIQSKIEFLKYKFSGGLLGEEWHGADQADPMKRSYAEQQTDSYKRLQLQEINEKIANRTKDSRKKGEEAHINSLIVQKRMIEFETEIKEKYGSETQIRAMSKQDRDQIYSQIDSERKAMISREFDNVRKNGELEVRDLKLEINKKSGGRVSEAQINEIFELNLDKSVPKTATGYEQNYKTRLEQILGREVAATEVKEIRELSTTLQKSQKNLKDIKKREADLTEISLKYVDRVAGKQLRSLASPVLDIYSDVWKFGLSATKGMRDSISKQSDIAEERKALGQEIWRATGLSEKAIEERVSERLKELKSVDESSLRSKAYGDVKAKIMSDPAADVAKLSRAFDLDDKIKSDNVTKQGLEKEIKDLTGLSDKQLKSIEEKVNNRFEEIKKANPSMLENDARSKAYNDILKDSEVVAKYAEYREVDGRIKQASAERKGIEKATGFSAKAIEEKVSERLKELKSSDDIAVRAKAYEDVKTKIVSDLQKSNPAVDITKLSRAFEEYAKVSDPKARTISNRFKEQIVELTQFKNDAQIANLGKQVSEFVKPYSFDDERRSELKTIRDLRNLELKEARLGELQVDNHKRTQQGLEKISALETKLQEFSAREEKAYKTRVDNISENFKQTIDVIEKESKQYALTHKDKPDDVAEKSKVYLERIEEVKATWDARLKGEESELQSKIKKKDQELGVAKAYETFYRSLEERSKKIESFERDVAILQERLSVRADEMGYVDRSKDIKEISKLDAQIHRTDSDLKKSLESIEKLKFDIQEREVKSLSEAFKQATPEDRKALREQIASLEDRLIKLEASSSKDLEDVSKLQEQRTESLSKKASLASDSPEIARIDSDIKASEEKIKKLSESINARNEEFEKLRTEFKDATGMQGKVIQIQEEKYNVRSEEDKNALLKLEREYQDLQNAKNILVQEKHKIEEVGFEKIEAAARSEMQIKRTDSEIDQTSRQIDAVSQRMKDMTNAYDADKKSISEMKDVSAEQKDMLLKAAEQKFNEHTEQATEKIKYLETEKAKLEETGAHLKQEYEKVFKDPLSELLSGGANANPLLQDIKNPLIQDIKNPLIQDKGDALTQAILQSNVAEGEVKTTHEEMTEQHEKMKDFKQKQVKMKKELQEIKKVISEKKAPKSQKSSEEKKADAEEKKKKQEEAKKTAREERRQNFMKKKKK